MSYIVKENGQYDTIIEKDTGVEIKMTRSKKEMFQLTRKLNLGSGFNGWTPEFFARDVTSL